MDYRDTHWFAEVTVGLLKWVGIRHPFVPFTVSDFMI